MVKTVVVLGASFAGLAVSHRLLKYTRQTEPELRVVLVSRNSHFYWNLGAIRAVVPGLIKDEQIFHAIEPGFAQYPKESFEFVLGSAKGVDTAKKTASISTSQGDKTVTYDYLVLATGARATNEDSPWKAHGTYEEALALLHKTAEKIKAAKHIVVAGAGATGVETSAEIRYECKDKEVVLLSGGEELLNGDTIATGVEREITKLGVQVKKNSRVAGSKALPDGKTEVSLEGGEKIVTDFYLPTMGLLPNTDFLDAKLLNERKYVDVDDFFRVKGAENVWACGDIVSKPRAGFMITDKQAAGVAKNVEQAIKGKDQLPVKGLPFDMFVCATGRDRGVGRAGYVRLPSIAVWAVKGRTLAMDWAPKYVNGTQW